MLETGASVDCSILNSLVTPRNSGDLGTGTQLDGLRVITRSYERESTGRSPVNNLGCRFVLKLKGLRVSDAYTTSDCTIDNLCRARGFHNGHRHRNWAHC
jgi:hypothetical protein